jgi:hypothetical protein
VLYKSLYKNNLKKKIKINYEYNFFFLKKKKTCLL